jgi:hypothetical protein
MPAARFVGIFVGIVLVSEEQTFTATFAIPNEGIEQMARKNGGARANPKQIRTDVDCRAARPKFDNGAWSPAKISDVTGGGLYLFVTPDESRPGNAASKLWRMGYRFHSRQKTYSIGPYGNGKDGTFSLADARRERDKAKDLLKDGKDPSTEKQLVKHRQAAARPFEQWADEWLAKKKVEKVKRGRIVAVRDPKTRPSRCLSYASATLRIASASCAGRTSSVLTCSLSCVHTKPRESWKPATACAASVSKSATMPMSKATATIHSAT